MMKNEVDDSEKDDEAGRIAKPVSRIGAPFLLIVEGMDQGSRRWDGICMHKSLPNGTSDIGH